MTGNVVDYSISYNVQCIEIYIIIKSLIQQYSGWFVVFWVFFITNHFTKLYKTSVPESLWRRIHWPDARKFQVQYVPPTIVSINHFFSAVVYIRIHNVEDLFSWCREGMGLHRLNYRQVWVIRVKSRWSRYVDFVKKKSQSSWEKGRVSRPSAVTLI